MNFIKYCELPENEQWITQFMYTMKLDTGFDADALIDAVEEQAELEGIILDDAHSEDILDDDLSEAYGYSRFFAEWYDELECPDEREFPPRSGAV